MRHFSALKLFTPVTTRIEMAKSLVPSSFSFGMRTIAPIRPSVHISVMVFAEVLSALEVPTMIAVLGRWSHEMSVKISSLICVGC